MNIEDQIDCANNHYANIINNSDTILRLALPYSKTSVTVVDLLKEYFSTHNMGVFTKCGDCSGNRFIQKRFVDFPSILFVQLKRYLLTENNKLIKNKTQVHIDFNFEFNMFNDEIKKEYELVSIVCHKGNQSIQHGHYITYCREVNDNWSIYNDADVRIANFSNTKTDDYKSCLENAYLLCYVIKQEVTI